MQEESCDRKRGVKWLYMCRGLWKRTIKERGSKRACSNNGVAKDGTNGTIITKKKEENKKQEKGKYGMRRLVHMPSSFDLRFDHTTRQPHTLPELPSVPPALHSLHRTATTAAAAALTFVAPAARPPRSSCQHGRSGRGLGLGGGGPITCAPLPAASFYLGFDLYIYVCGARFASAEK